MTFFSAEVLLPWERGENGIYSHSGLAVLHIALVGIERGLVKMVHMEKSLYRERRT